MNRYFTSVPLAKWASEKRFTVAGTIRLDRVCYQMKLKLSRNEKKIPPSIYIKKKKW